MQLPVFERQRRTVLSPLPFKILVKILATVFQGALSLTYGLLKGEWRFFEFDLRFSGQVNATLGGSGHISIGVVPTFRAFLWASRILK